MWKIKRLIKEKIFEESREVKSITGNMKQPKYKIQANITKRNMQVE